MATSKSKPEIYKRSQSVFSSSFPNWSESSVRKSSSMAKSKSRKKTTPSVSISKSLDLVSVENEYIRNLQQQIHFLELENDYLREQAGKAAEEIPQTVALEAEKMAQKIKIMHRELKSREDVIVKNESAINLLQQENKNTLSKIDLVEESFNSEKRELINQIVELKKTFELNELDLKRKEGELKEAKSELANTLLTVKDYENKVASLNQHRNEKTNEHNSLRVAYEEKRSECLKLQTEYQELEDRFFRSKVNTNEKAQNELKSEMKKLKYDLREKEMQAEQDRSLRFKISDDCAALVKENAGLSSRVIELEKQLDAEIKYQEDESNRKQTNIQELVTIREERKYLERELETCKEALEKEKAKYQKLMNKFIDEEENHTRERLQGCKLKSELDEVECMKSVESSENIKLRRDKLLLSDQVKDLKRKLQEQYEDNQELISRCSDLREELEDTKSKLRFESNYYDKIKWEEFEHIADQMKEFSRSMSPLKQSTTLARKSRTRLYDTDS